ncbi:MAG TPA: class I SAM-dependent methyltransferase [Solirubrobacteraceae bacterium]|nr:class I SAM-dependent methyltransferase [Solirubrobacteraceae bacterium]
MSTRSRLGALGRRARRFGARYVAAELALRTTRRAGERLEDTLLEIEGARGVLGPAHQRWRDNSAAENRRRWEQWDWSHLGEEWTASEPWKRALVDEVLLPTIPPGGTVLEIGPGGGRWSVVLQPRAERLILVDVAQRPLDLVAERLGERGNVEYVLTSGSALVGVGDASVDAVWSFDVFVHVAPVDQAGYLAEIARVLRPRGVAAIHHADGRNRGVAPSRQGWRAPMTAELFAALARERGLAVERQLRSWSGGAHGLDAFNDVITVLRRPG